MTQTPDTSSTTATSLFAETAKRSAAQRAAIARQLASQALASYLLGNKEEPPPNAELEDALIALADDDTPVDAVVEAALWVDGYLGTPERIGAWLALPADRQFELTWPPGVIAEAGGGFVFTPSTNMPHHPHGGVESVRARLATDARTRYEYQEREKRFEAAKTARATEEFNKALEVKRQAAEAEQASVDGWLAITGDARFITRANDRAPWMVRSWGASTPVLTLAWLARDPRTAAELNARSLDADQRNQALEAKIAREAESKRILLTAIASWESPTMLQGWRNGMIRTTDVIKLIHQQVFPSVSGQKRWHDDDEDILSPHEKIADVDRISADAYAVLVRVQRELGTQLRYVEEKLRLALQQTPEASGGVPPIGVEWELERVRSVAQTEEEVPRAAYTALCHFRFEGCDLTLTARCVLALTEP